MNATDKRRVDLYRRARAKGWNASDAHRLARVVTAWREAWMDDLVRLDVEDDPDPDVSWMDDEQRKDWDGTCYGTVMMARKSTDDEWEQVDSCWGHIGYADVADPFENAYVVDEMAAALDWLGRDY